MMTWWWSSPCCLLLGMAIASSSLPKTKAFLLNNKNPPSSKTTPQIHNAANIPTTTRTLYASSSSLNPNDMETPEERQRRMEMVRSLQKTFYSDSKGINQAQIHNKGILQDVPLWRVQWTELPGYQNVLHCHVPHYTHMFMSVLNGAKPWYFGHVYLPGGSENLDNPNYFLCNKEKDSEACHVGTLMRVSDYKQLEDGRLLIIAQALSKFKIVEVTQHLPYAIGTVELVPDRELVNRYYDEALELVLLEDDSSVEKKKEEQGIDGEQKGGQGLDVTSACWNAAVVGAITEAMHWESFEYRNVAVEECLEGGKGISPVANFDAMQIPMDTCNVNRVMKDFLSSSSSSSATATTRSSKDNTRPDNILSSNDEIQRVLDLERDVWIGVDFMIQLISAVNKNPNMPIPVPTQLLGLLPSTNPHDWPKGFQLDTYVQRLAKEKAFIGTMSKSPFVVVNDVSASSSSAAESPISYPPLRRAQRLSYVIWVLMENILEGYVPAAMTRQSVLELDSITERLEAVKRGLDAINGLLRQALEGRR